MLKNLIIVFFVVISASCSVAEKSDQPSSSRTTNQSNTPVAKANEEDGICGTKDPSPEEIAGLEKALASITTKDAPAAPKVIPVYLWVIRSGALGEVTAAQATQLVAALNKEVGRKDFTFRLDGRTEVTDHPEWYLMATDSPAELAAKKSLRKGGGETLNIWTADPGKNANGIQLAGYARRKSGSVLDGVVVAPHLVNSATAIHETGHWMGLLHVFQGGCIEPNDLVADTPQQKVAGSGCPASADSCPASGVDPITNYMNYGTCRTTFTAGQYARMFTISLVDRGSTPLFATTTLSE